MSKRMGNCFDFYISFFEIYGGRLYDLLNNRSVLQVLDDKNGKVNIYGLVSILADSPDQMHTIIDNANAIRTTHNTVTNETSSRSHAICNIVVKKKGEDEEFGKLSLVDLAGSERAQETQSNNRQRRAEGAEINKSLLALKECIRALEERKNGNADQHVPFRASKLTHVLRDSFVSKSDKSRIIMISCVAPSYSSANHSINTLRYSDRLKEQTKSHGVVANNNRGMNKPSGGGQVYSKPSVQGNKGNLNQIRQVDDINMNIVNFKEVTQKNEVNFNDRMEIDETPNKGDKKGEEDDWDYLRKTANREGKMLSEDFIKYHQLTDKLVEDEDDIMNTHMGIIKEDAKMLTEEGDLISNIKGIGKETDFKMDEYITGLERIINRKLFIYGNLKKKLDMYKQHIKEEDVLRKKLNPKYFMDN